MKKFVFMVLLVALTGFHWHFKNPLDGVKFVENKKADGKEKAFKDVLGEFKGKVVYVDYWASWCSPCRQQFPYSKEIHEKMKGKNVVFLYISYDQNEAAWKKGIEALEIKGYHWYPTENQKLEIYQLYSVSGIPRYMIVDKTGKVVDDDAPRPSEADRVIKKIEALL